MPILEYECDICKFSLEYYSSDRENLLTDCPNCQKPLSKKFSLIAETKRHWGDTGLVHKSEMGMPKDA